MGNVSASSCRSCMFVSCLHPVAVLHAEFCMNCSLLMLVEDARGDHLEETYSMAVIDNVCELFGETIRNMFVCVFLFCC